MLRRSSTCHARRARLRTRQVAVETPVFMPVGTQATVKGISQQELAALGFPILLGNTYHLHLRPGEDRIRAAGGLHRFMGWPGAILTDSGGFQAYSLQSRCKVTDAGVLFHSHIDGSPRRFTPEIVLDIQQSLGADVAMVLDECVANPCEHPAARKAMERTHSWASRSLDYWRSLEPNGAQLFGIVQGSHFADLRGESAACIAGMGFDGVAIGGVSVGETQEQVYRVIRETTPLLPEDRPRYLMGVGTPLDVLEAISWGVDMFDCVLPTRLGRTGSAYTSVGRLNIKGARFRDDFRPLDPECDCWCCSYYTAGYIHHLYRAGEMLAARLLTHHNLAFYARVTRDARSAIEEDRYPEYRNEFVARYRAGRD